MAQSPTCLHAGSASWLLGSSTYFLLIFVLIILRHMVQRCCLLFNTQAEHGFRLSMLAVACSSLPSSLLWEAPRKSRPTRPSNVAVRVPGRAVAASISGWLVCRLPCRPTRVSDALSPSSSPFSFRFHDVKLVGRDEVSGEEGAVAEWYWPRHGSLLTGVRIPVP